MLENEVGCCQEMALISKLNVAVFPVDLTCPCLNHRVVIGQGRVGVLFQDALHEMTHTITPVVFNGLLKIRKCVKECIHVHVLSLGLSQVPLDVFDVLHKMHGRIFVLALPESKRAHLFNQE